MIQCKIGEDCGCGYTNTGYDGSGIWDKIHAIPKQIECEECADHADFNLKGLHDAVNVGLGKKPHDNSKYKRWVDEINCNFNKCVKDGRC